MFSLFRTRAAKSRFKSPPPKVAPPPDTSVKVGAIYVPHGFEANPFLRRGYRIKDVKDGYVLYETAMRETNGEWIHSFEHSCAVHRFRERFALYHTPANVSK